MGPSDAELLAVLHAAAGAVQDAIRGLRDWSPTGGHDGQYRHDLVADEAAIKVISAAGWSVFSEESGGADTAATAAAPTAADPGITVVLDPIDGSTNANRGIPWYNTSLCAIDATGMRAAVVLNHVSGERYEATRGGGARCDGRPLEPSRSRSIAESIIGLNGYPRHNLGWKQYRALGSAALDLCAVAAGVLDGYVDCTRSGLATWDYLGAALICEEAGAAITRLDGETVSPAEGASLEGRHVIVAAGSAALLDELVDQRRRFA